LYSRILKKRERKEEKIKCKRRRKEEFTVPHHRKIPNG
jgi:hypothetical protein